MKPCQAVYFDLPLDTNYIITMPTQKKHVRTYISKELFDELEEYRLSLDIRPTISSLVEHIIEKFIRNRSK